MAGPTSNIYLSSEDFQLPWIRVKYSACSGFEPVPMCLSAGGCTLISVDVERHPRTKGNICHRATVWSIKDLYRGGDHVPFIGWRLRFQRDVDSTSAVAISEDGNLVAYLHEGLLQLINIYWTGMEGRIEGSSTMSSNRWSRSPVFSLRLNHRTGHFAYKDLERICIWNFKIFGCMEQPSDHPSFASSG
jgi:hypothetical protein